MAEYMTPNAIMEILEDKKPANPVVQVLAFKKINNQVEGNKPDRYRLQISDGTYKQNSAMLSSPLNHLITDGLIQKNAIVSLKKYTCNSVSGKKLIILMLVDVIQSDAGYVVGNPVSLREDGEADGPGNGPAMSPAPANHVQGHMNYNPNTAAFQQPPPPSGSAHQFGQLPLQQVNGFQHQQQNPYSSSKPSFSSAVSVPNPHQQQQNVPPRGGTMNMPFQPIDSLNPYLQKICIRCRVTAKPAKKTWENAKGKGVLFSMDLLDESGEIRATGFNNIVDKYYDIIEVGKVYYIKGGKLKNANKKFSSLKNNYELTLDDSSEIIPVMEDVAVPQQKFSFMPLSKLEEIDVKATPFVDVMGICTNPGTLETGTTRSNDKPFTKRDLQLMDENQLAINCTLWGKEAEEFVARGGGEGVVVAIKAAKLSDFNGRTLSASNSSTIMLNPDIPEAHRLMGWFSQMGKGAQVRSLTVKNAPGASRRIVLSQIMSEGLGGGEKPDYFLVKGTVTFIKKDAIIYKACLNADCSNKKLVEEPPGSGRLICGRCSADGQQFKYRLMINAAVTDVTGQIWVTLFHEAAEQLLGKTADDIGALFEQDPMFVERLASEACFRSFMFNCRCKNDTYQDTARLKVSATTALPVDYKQEAAYLADQVKKLMTL